MNKRYTVIGGDDVVILETDDRDEAIKLARAERKTEHETVLIHDAESGGLVRWNR